MNARQRLTVATAESQGLDATDGRWVVVCERHHTIVNTATRALARSTTGEDFCDGCRDTGTVTCDECGGEHVAEFSHVGGYDTKVRVYAVICTDPANPELLTDYYTEEVVRHG